VDPTLDPNATVRAETSRDAVARRRSLTLYKKGRFSTQRNAAIERASNFETGAVKPRSQVVELALDLSQNYWLARSSILIVGNVMDNDPLLIESVVLP
jgi:hypothetical protein